MHTTTLQALIQTTAKQIAMRAALIDMHVDAAREHRVDGEKAFMVAAFKKADKLRTKLAKDVALQRTLKAELQAAFRLARIQRKIDKLATVGFKYEVPVLTTYEMEAALDRLLLAFLPAVVKQNNDPRTKVA